MSRRVLVTGGAGFIGSHVCEAYMREGWEVTALDDLSRGRRENLPDGVELVEMDVRSERVVSLFAERRFDLVNHHAAQVDVRISVSDPRLDASINLDGSLNLLEAARVHGTTRFLFISSGGVVYGEPPEERLPLVETEPKLPLSPYGVSKLTVEHYLHAYRELHGLDYAALRYSNVYGPRQDPHGEAGVVAIFGGRLLEGRSLTVFGDGLQTRDYVYVKDVANANLLLSELGAEALRGDGGLDGPAFHVATGRETSVLDLAGAMMEVTGRRVEVEHAPARPGELERNCLDVSKLRALGWEPRTPLGEGLRETVAHLEGERG